MGSLAGILARRLAPAFAAACVLVLFAHAGSAAADSSYTVTYVARSCPSYDVIYANRARNDIMESLKDLGPDSQYPASGNFQVNPDAESMPPQDVCRPIVGWRFTLGTGIETTPFDPRWGSLSRVTSPYSTSIETRVQAPLLNENGDQIGNQTIPGAVTVPLTSAQATQASSPSSLWVQGGEVDDPVLASIPAFAGPKYGFGALRCAVDALNGDNVEYIYFPAGVKHVFCYALYVTPPPSAGTITIEKRVTGAPAGDDTSFPFSGDLSFDPGGFQLTDGESNDFVRAGGVNWHVTEGHVDGFALSSVDCSSTGPSSTWTPGATTEIHLVAPEHVTCVYNNHWVPPPGGLTIRKITAGGTGSFDYVVTGGGGSHRASATTTKPRVPVNASPSPLSLAPGTYTIRERRPTSPDGRWRLVRASCNGSTIPSRPVQVDVRSGEGSVCTFVNRFIPRGSISLAKVTYGGTGTAQFVIDPNAGTPRQFRQTATTTHAGVPADAKPVTAADATDHLRLGSYTIVEQPPLTLPAGEWTLSSVICNGVVQPFDQGAITVQLTRQHPSVHCKFADTFTSHPPPDPPPVVPPTPPVNPPGGGGSPSPVDPITDLAVTKQAFPSTVLFGHVVTYRVTVRNAGDFTAQRVVVTDENVVRGKILSIHTPVGTCRILPRASCLLGNLKPGAKVVITARAIPPIVGRFRNVVAVGSASDETNLSNNRAHTTVLVLARPSPPPPSVTG